MRAVHYTGQATLPFSGQLCLSYFSFNSSKFNTLWPWITGVEGRHVLTMDTDQKARMPCTCFAHGSSSHPHAVTWPKAGAESRQARWMLGAVGFQRKKPLFSLSSNCIYLVSHFLLQRPIILSSKYLSCPYPCSLLQIFPVEPKLQVPNFFGPFQHETFEHFHMFLLKIKYDTSYCHRQYCYQVN